MKYFFIFVFLFLVNSFSNRCQYHNKIIEEEQPFKINGKIDDLNSENFIFKYLRCRKDDWVIDTISVVNGTFTIEGITYPGASAVVSINDKEVFFYLDPGKMQLYLKKDSLKSLVLKGSQTQLDFEALKFQMKPIEDYFYKVKRQLSSEQNEQNKDFLTNQKDSIENLLDNVQIDFIISHPSSFLSLDVIINLIVSKKQNIDVLMNLFDGLFENLRTSCHGKYVYSLILKRKKSTITNVSSLKAFDKDGNLVKLLDFEGKYILIDFWASWCIPCVKGFHHLKELYSKYKNKLVVINISIDREEDKQKWLNAIEKNEIGEWIHILSYENKGENNICDLHDTLPGSSIPHYILIDQSGNVIKQWRGFSNEVTKEQDKMFENILENKK